MSFKSSSNDDFWYIEPCSVLIGSVVGNAWQSMEFLMLFGWHIGLVATDFYWGGYYTLVLHVEQLVHALFISARMSTFSYSLSFYLTFSSNSFSRLLSKSMSLRDRIWFIYGGIIITFDFLELFLRVSTAARYSQISPSMISQMSQTKVVWSISALSQSSLLTASSCPSQPVLPAFSAPASPPPFALAVNYFASADVTHAAYEAAEVSDNAKTAADTSWGAIGVERCE